MKLPAKKAINLTVATEMGGNGGIGTVLSVLDQKGFFSKWNVVLLASHTASKRWFYSRRMYFYFKTLSQLVYYHLFYHVNLVHVHMSIHWSYKRKSYVIRLTKWLGGHVVLHLHAGAFKEFYQKDCNEKEREKIRKVFNLSDRVVVLSTQWLAWVREILEQPEKASIVYNSVPNLELSRENTDPNLILFMGKLDQKKGLGDLIYAFAQIANEFPEAHLVLGGDGDIGAYRAKVEKLKLSERVEFLGWVSGRDKLDLLARAGIYVLPSYYEGFPMGVLEAMSAGVPILASKVGGIPDAVTDEKEGILIDAGDIDALVSALRTLLSNKDVRDRFSILAKEKYRKQFSPEVVLPKLDDIYASFY